MSKPNNRPLSPHLQVYKPQITSVLSITHRMTGVFLSMGLLAIVYYFRCLSTGEQSFETLRGLLKTPVGLLFMLAWSFSLFYHLSNGIRHLFWDVGKGFELADMQRSGCLVILMACGLTALTWMGVVLK